MIVTRGVLVMRSVPLSMKHTRLKILTIYIGIAHCGPLAPIAHCALRSRRARPQCPDLYHLPKWPRRRPNNLATKTVKTVVLPTTIAQSRAQSNWYPLQNLGNGPGPLVAPCGCKYVHPQRCPTHKDKSESATTTPFQPMYTQSPNSHAAHAASGAAPGGDRWPAKHRKTIERALQSTPDVYA